MAKKSSASELLANYGKKIEAQIKQEKMEGVDNETKTTIHMDTEKLGEQKTTSIPVETEKEEIKSEKENEIGEEERLNKHPSPEGKKEVEFLLENRELLEFVCKNNPELFKDQKRLPGILYAKNHEILTKLAQAKKTNLENLTNNILYQFIQANKNPIIKIIKESSKIDL